MIAKVEIRCAALSDIIESACKLYRQRLAESDDMDKIKSIIERLVDVMLLWEAADNFDVDDELLLTIEKRDEERPVKVDVCH